MCSSLGERGACRGESKTGECTARPSLALPTASIRSPSLKRVIAVVACGLLATARGVCLPRGESKRESPFLMCTGMASHVFRVVPVGETVSTESALPLNFMTAAGSKWA